MSSPATDAWPAAQVVKNSGREQQFGFAEHGALDPLADLGGVGAGCAGQRDCGLKRTLQAWLRTSPMNSAPPGASRSMALSMTSARYPALGKYWTTELRMMVSKWPCGSVSVTWAGWVNSWTRSRHGICNCSSEPGQGVDDHRRHIGGDIAFAPRGDL